MLDKSGADSNYTEKSLFFVNQWKGFCLRGFDYSTLQVLNADSLTLITTDDSEQRLSEDQSQAIYENEPEVKQQISEQEQQELNQRADQIRQLVLRSDCDRLQSRLAICKRIIASIVAKLFPFLYIRPINREFRPLYSWYYVPGNLAAL